MKRKAEPSGSGSASPKKAANGTGHGAADASAVPAAAAAPPALKLTYFNIQGVAEKVRLALVVQGVAFEDERIDFKTWMAMKPTTKFGQLPLLTIDGSQTIAQSGAMLRYVAGLKSQTLYPVADARATLLVEEVLGLVDDFSKAWTPGLYMGMKPHIYGHPDGHNKTEEGRKLVQRLRCSFVEETLPKFMAWFGDYLGEREAFLVGSNVTIADLSLLPVLARFMTSDMDFIESTTLDAYPKITAWVARMHSLPALQSWYAPQPKASAAFFRFGRPGEKWGAAEQAEWQADVDQAKRTYQEHVLAKLEPLKARFDVQQYGSLKYIDETRFPLFAVKTKNWTAGRPTVLVTGGVHGYETSGVQGALLFLETKAEEYSATFNIVVVPCVSPWGYENIQRWNRNAEDPNRGFYPKSSVQECACVMALVESLGGRDAFKVHLDLHETTDTDETEFRPAKAARDGLAFNEGTIPDGFYLVGDSENPQEAWQAAILASVKEVTHIVKDASIMDIPVSMPGLVAVDAKSLFLCSSVTNATFTTTTEVYPDSKGVTDEECNRAQVAAVTGGLDFVLSQGAC